MIAQTLEPTEHLPRRHVCGACGGQYSTAVSECPHCRIRETDAANRAAVAPFFAAERERAAARRARAAHIMRRGDTR